MRTSIDIVKQYVEYLVRKNTTSGTITPSQFNLIINRAQKTIFVNRVGNPHEYQAGHSVPQMAFQVTQKITEDLKVFKENANLVLNNLGQVNYPTDLAYTIPGLSYKTSVGSNVKYITIDIVDNAMEGYRLSSKIVQPTKKYPIAICENIYLQVYPLGISNIRFPYLRYPKDSLWAYTTVNGRPVYDSSKSVDLEWEDLVVNDIIATALSSIGISIKDVNVSQFANQKEQTGA